MRRILFLALSAFSLEAYTQTAAEEAIILNQELQFLQDSVNSVLSSADTPVASAPEVTEAPPRTDLERTYFSDEQRDEVPVRSSAPKRRSF